MGKFIFVVFTLNKPPSAYLYWLAFSHPCLKLTPSADGGFWAAAEDLTSGGSELFYHR